MKNTLGFLVLGAATFACSGHYYEVGAMDGTGGAPGGHASSKAGSPGTVEPGPDASGGTAADAGPARPASRCESTGAPSIVTGAFAEPFEVWRRVAMLTYGKPVPPPSKLPATTTYAWAGVLVTTGLANARQTLGTAPGVELFLRQALDLDASATFRAPWGMIASTDDGLLNALLRAPLDEAGRVGIFTEPSWLVKKPTISARGAAIERALFGVMVPEPPVDLVTPPPDPVSTDRQALQSALANPACAACHQLIDPSGFALGHFAADGSYRDLDHDMPIDATGARRVAPDMGPEEFVQFDGIADFGAKFSQRCEATLGIADTFLRAALVINEAPEAARAELFEANHDRVEQAFVNSNRTYEDLVRAYIQSPAGLRP
jgi:hypothetical protein